MQGPIRAAWVSVVLAVLILGALLARRVRRHRDLGTEAERATFETLHTASQAAAALREGLTPLGARRAVRHLRTLLGTSAVALTDAATTLAWDGSGDHHSAAAIRYAAGVLASGHTAVLDARQIDAGEPASELTAKPVQACEVLDCPIRTAVVVPVTGEDAVVGALIAYGPAVSAGLVRATEEVAKWVSAQVELAELDRSRTRAIEAELRALRAQISPHFVYNSLAAIASFVRTDPERARDLLLEFADFTRYALPRTRAGPVRRAIAGSAPDRPGGTAGGGPVPGDPAAGGERRPARAASQAGGRPRHARRAGRGSRGLDLGGGRRRGHRSGARPAGAGR
jgi:two-component system LytT family sensor kinase